MISIGLTGWGDHESLYGSRMQSANKLHAYSEHFPIVEVDSAFYAIQPRKNSEKWVRETPEKFQFIVKAYQGMTGHTRGETPFESREEMFVAFRESLKPYQEHSKLAMALFQFPPWFDCTRANVDYIRWCREQCPDLPLALEFRNRTWFSEPFHDKTLRFMEEDGWIHSICDEPQAGEGSVPTVLQPTHKQKTLIRMHGRNVHGWNKPSSGEDWRAVRFLYRYNKRELMEWVENLRQLQKQTEHIYIVFNNNSGGDAADNAKELISYLGIEYETLAPKQLDLFGDL